MPNIHFLPVNLKNKDGETIVKVGILFTSGLPEVVGNTEVANLLQSYIIVQK